MRATSVRSNPLSIHVPGWRSLIGLRMAATEARHNGGNECAFWFLDPLGGPLMLDRILTSAIRANRLIEFCYNGEPRTVEPYRLGLDGGRLRLVGWQSRKGWRSFYVDGMVDLEVTDRTFLGPREGYVRGDPHLDRILAEV